MKSILIASCLALVALVLLPGCQSKSSDGVDTSKVESSFQGADPDLKTLVSKAVDDVKAQNWQAALGDLQAILGNAKVTPEQKQAVNDLMAQVRDKITAGAKGVGDKARDAAGDVGKTLGK